jgi:uncharacterized membrane protein
MQALAMLVVLGLAATPLLLLIVSLVVASQTRARLRALEEANARLQEQVNALASRVKGGLVPLAVAHATVEPEAGALRAPTPVPRQAVTPLEGPTPPRPSAELSARAVGPPALSREPAGQPATLPDTAPEPATPPAMPLASPSATAPAVAPATPLPSPPPASGIAPPATPPLVIPAASLPAPPALPSKDATPGARSSPPLAPAGPMAPRTPRPPRPPQPPRPQQPSGFDWESLVGVRLFSAVAGIALVVAAVFFLRYSIDQGWLQPPVRVAIGVLTGLSLLVVCERKAARRYAVTANALDAAAVSILFATFFAAHALWNLLPALPTFLLLALVAAVAVLLSIRHDSLFIAVLGLLGGFSTPALLSTGENRPVPLFAYLLLLNLGLAWVARERGWPLLTGLSLALTTLYQWGWVLKFLDARQVPLATGIFLVFPAASLGVLVLARGRRPTAAADRPLQDTALLGATLPLLFTLYLAAVPGYGARFGILFGFLFLLDVSLLAIGLFRREFLLHLAGGLGTLLTFAVWLARSYTSEAWPALLGALAVFVALYLGAESLARRMGRKADAGLSTATLAAPLLLVTLPALVLLEPAVEQPLLAFGAGLALLALLAAVAIGRERGSLYFLAAFFVLIAEAVWSARYLAPETLAQGLALYAIFGVAYLGVPVLARAVGRPLEPKGAGGLVLIAALFLLLYLAGRGVAPGALFGLALLLAILNAGLFIEAASTRLSGLSVAGGFLSWIVLGSWWIEASGSVPLLPALAVVTGLALLMVAGHAWAGKRVGGAEGHGFGVGSALGLVAHLFLVAVASDPALGVPPWPLFVVLLVLTLAFGAAALWIEEGLFQVAGVAAGAIVLLVWAAHAPTPAWSTVALAALAAFAVLALMAIRVASSAGDGGPAWPAAAAVAVFAVHAGAILVSGATAPATIVLAAAHVAALGTFLALATTRGWHALGLLAVGTSSVAVFAFAALHGRPEDWGARLGLAAAVYVVFLAWPMAAGDAAVGAREPWLGAILASAPFFFAARPALAAGGYGSVIGALPLAQALAMALLLRRLLAIEPARRRDTGRLALVAGTALAFVTVAIPLQLEKQWITIGWALEGAALAWLYRRIRHRGLLWTSAGLLGAAFVRLAMNPEVLRYAERSAVPVFNWYLYTYLACATALLVAGWLLLREDDRLVAGLPRASTAAFAAAGVLLFLLLNIEIADFYAEGPTFDLRFGARLDQDLTYTIGWLLFGLGLLAVGILTHSRGARLTALALVAVTACKGFLYDLARLGGLYRVASFVGLAVTLALVSVALQRFVLRSRREEP